MDGLRNLCFLLIERYNKYNQMVKSGDIPTEKISGILEKIFKDLSLAQNIIVTKKFENLPMDEANLKSRVQEIFNKVVVGFKEIEQIGKNDPLEKKKFVLNFIDTLLQIEEKFNLSTNEEECLYLKAVYIDVVRHMKVGLDKITAENIFFNDPEIKKSKKWYLNFENQLKLLYESTEKEQLKFFSHENLIKISDLYKDQKKWNDKFHIELMDDQEELEGSGGGAAGGGAAKEIEPNLDELLQGLSLEKGKAAEIKKAPKKKKNQGQTKNYLPPPSIDQESIPAAPALKNEVTLKETVINTIYRPLRAGSKFTEDKRVKRWDIPNLTASYILGHKKIFSEYQGINEREINHQIVLHAGQVLHRLLGNPKLQTMYAKKTFSGFTMDGTLDLKTGIKIDGRFEFGVGSKDGKVFHRGFIRNMWGKGFDSLTAVGLKTHAERFSGAQEEIDSEEEQFTAVSPITTEVDEEGNIKIKLEAHSFLEGYTILKINI